MPCGPRCDANQKNPAGAHTLPSAGEGAQSSPGFLLLQVPSTWTCMLSIYPPHPPRRQKAPAPNASRGRRPAGTSSSER